MKNKKIQDGSGLDRRKQLFLETPMWKLLLKMCSPGVIIMSIMGLYNFSDNLLSINFAHDSYSRFDNLPLPGHPGQTINMSKDLVRMIMSSALPPMNLSLALIFLITVGVSTRISINLGWGDIERAKNTIKTGTMVGMGIMIISIPIIIFTSKSWIGLQIARDIPQQAQELIKEEGFKYVSVLVGVNCIFFFNNMVSSLLRTEGRMKEATLAMFIPVLFNLLADYLLMGPGGMGVLGAAIATAIANIITLALLLTFMFKFKDFLISLKNMFGFKFSIISLVGILLVDAAPFFRNSTQAVTGTVKANVIRELTKVLYKGQQGQMINILSGVFPIFGLFSPLLFGIIQGAAPVASYNFGANKISMVKKAVLWSGLYGFILGIIIYILAAVLLANPLMTALGVNDKAKYGAKHVILIMMMGAPLFAPAISGMILFSSTDRVAFSFISATARGYIIFFPIIFIFRALALAHPENLYIYICIYILMNVSCSIIWNNHFNYNINLYYVT